MIKTVQGPDDVASLQEILQRRYTRQKQENKALPDLILVDGGKGQLNTARKILKKIGLVTLVLSMRGIILLIYVWLQEVGCIVLKNFNSS